MEEWFIFTNQTSKTTDEQQCFSFIILICSVSVILEVLFYSGHKWSSATLNGT